MAANARTNHLHASPDRLTESPQDEPAWFANDHFWHAAEPWLFPAPFWTIAPYEVESILEISGKPETCRVLDLGCGPGRVALQFARRGARVTGVDLNQAYLAKAAKAASHARLDVEWVHSDMRAYKTDATFDIAVCLYNTFGYFADDNADALVIANIYASVAPEGFFVLDHLGREICEHAISLDPYVETRAGVTVEHRAELRRNNSVLHCEWEIVAGERTDRFATEQFVYSADEISSLIQKAGFRTVECFGGYERTPYTPESDRLLVVASK